VSFLIWLRNLRVESHLTSDSNWKWPQIPGLHDFKGDLVHSANWPENFEYSGRKVAVIGNGSSGVQIVPALQPSKFRVSSWY
jgi:cation diffusion facilitator CzcD-associated flavoprotein CzcO